jgi:hypothetical protein
MWHSNIEQATDDGSKDASFEKSLPLVLTDLQYGEKRYIDSPGPAGTEQNPVYAR